MKTIGPWKIIGLIFILINIYAITYTHEVVKQPGKIDKNDSFYTKVYTE
jgi:hypothetical protein